MSHPDNPDTDGVAALRNMRTQRARRQTPPSRHPRPAESEQPPTDSTEPPGGQTEAPQPDPSGETSQSTPTEADAPAERRPGGRHRDDSPRRRRNVALKRVQDAANSWAAQAAKTAWRTNELGEFAKSATSEGVERSALADAVRVAAERHDIDPAKVLSRDMARTVGLTRRR